ncbi:MAG: restriction endonuclease subunit S [Prevotella sp.]|nr:restriction endonuclease subunit S [Prevotella sp.]
MKCIDEEIPFEVPKGWEWCRFSSLYLSLTDGTHSTPKYTLAGIPFISVKDISSGIIDFSNTKYISKEEHQKLSDRCHPQKGDLLLSKVGTTGIPALVTTDQEFSLFVSVALIKLTQNKFSNEFLVFMIQSPLVQEQAKENTRGVGNKNWVLSAVSKTLMVVPPLEEQKRIKNRLNIVLPYIERYSSSQDKLDLLNVNIVTYLKKSILQEAIKGKLVSQCAEEGTAKELLEQIKAEKQKLVKEGKLKKSALNDSIIFRGDDNKYYEQIDDEPVCIDNFLPFQIPETWTWCKVKDLLEIQTGASFKKEQANTHNEGVRILRGGNILPNRYIFKDDDVFVAKEFVNENTLLKRNSIITPAVTSLENIGKMAVIEKDYNDVSAGGFVFIISPYIQEFTHSLLLAYFLQSPSLIETMQGITKKSGAAFYNLGKERLKELYIPLPPRKEQQRIVAQIEKLFEQLR